MESDDTPTAQATIGDVGIDNVPSVVDGGFAGIIAFDETTR